MIASRGTTKKPIVSLDMNRARHLQLLRQHPHMPGVAGLSSQTGPQSRSAEFDAASRCSHCSFSPAQQTRDSVPRHTPSSAHQRSLHGGHSLLASMVHISSSSHSIRLRPCMSPSSLLAQPLLQRGQAVSRPCIRASFDGRTCMAVAAAGVRRNTGWFERHSRARRIAVIACCPFPRQVESQV